MIPLTDFLAVPYPEQTKVKFNIRAGSNGEAAWDLLIGDDQEEWLNMSRYRSRQANNNLGDAKYLLSFAQYYPYGRDYYAFGGFFAVEAIVPEIINGHGYRLTALPDFADYEKRLIVRLKEPIGRNIYLRNYATVQSQLEPEVHELAPDTKLGAFPGYNNVRLTHHEMQRIIQNDEPSWRLALTSVKGIYVIADTSSGQLYVGSASGESGGLWQRWASYANLANLTGGNRELERLRQESGDEHIKSNFQYSILEIFDPKARAEFILERESFWKLALDSRRHGLNAN